MTREEAKDTAIKGLKRISDIHLTQFISDTKELIDKIYNEFEYRNCKTCKYFSEEYSTCSKSHNMNMAVDIDYLGCGMHEFKEEK